MWYPWSFEYFEYFEIKEFDEFTKFMDKPDAENKSEAKKCNWKS